MSNRRTFEFRPVMIIFLSAIMLAMTACSRHAVIIYDEPSSIKAGVAGLWCAAEIRDSCLKEVTEGEKVYAMQLLTAARQIEGCKNVTFVIDSGETTGNARNQLDQLRQGDYWVLRADLRPRMKRQPMTLLSKEGKPVVGSETNVEDAMKYMCEAAKHNGVTAIW